MTALRRRGLAVLNAGISTGLSVLLLAFGGSAIFTTFFWMLLGVVVIGLAHALLVLPAALALLPIGEASATYDDAPAVAEPGPSLTPKTVELMPPATAE